MRPRLLLVALPWLAVLLLVPPATAGPIEARRLWDEARKRRSAPWREQVRGYRAVLAEATPTDRYHRRALEALARVLRSEGLPHGAAALEARATRLGPRRDRGRLGSLLTHARGLRREGDFDAAFPLLEETACCGRNVAPTMADQARRLQAEDLGDQGDLDALEGLARTVVRERAGAPVRLRVLGALGIIRLEAGDARGARKALAEAERVYRTALTRDDDDATRCAKLWLDLELRRRLPDLPAGG